MGHAVYMGWDRRGPGIVLALWLILPQGWIASRFHKAIGLRAICLSNPLGIRVPAECAAPVGACFRRPAAGGLCHTSQSLARLAAMLMLSAADSRRFAIFRRTIEGPALRRTCLGVGFRARPVPLMAWHGTAYGFRAPGRGVHAPEHTF